MDIVIQVLWQNSFKRKTVGKKYPIPFVNKSNYLSDESSCFVIVRQVAAFYKRLSDLLDNNPEILKNVHAGKDCQSSDLNPKIYCFHLKFPEKQDFCTLILLICL